MSGVVKFRGTWRWGVALCRDRIIEVAIFGAVSASIYLLIKGQPLRLIWDFLVAYSGFLLGGALLLLVMLVLIGWMLPVKATPDGVVAALNGWGKRGVVEWADIRGVTADRLRGITTLELSRGDSSTARLPLPLDNFEELAAYVEKHAGAENPLANWLKTAKLDA